MQETTDPQPAAPRTAIAWLYALLLAALATGASLLLEHQLSVAGLAMVYLLATVAAAVLLPRGPAVLASVLAVSSLNFFFVPPRYTFAVEGVEYWWTLAVLLALSLGLGSLLASLREGRARALEGERRAAQVHALSETLAAEPDAEAMARAAARWLHETLGRRCAVFLREDGGLRCWPAGDAEDAFHPPSVRWSLDNGRPLGRGCDDWPDLSLWCAPFARYAPTGAVQVLLAPGDRPAADTLAHWQALVTQVGLCLERERASAAARRAEDSARAEAARNTLLASLSHDLRTPLAAIVGSASTLRAQAQDLSPAQRERLLASLEDEARDLTLMADNVLQLARLSQPQRQLRTQWEALEEILGAAAARMRRRWPQARIQLRVTPDLPPVQAEAALLAQVIANLVDNAARQAGGAPRIEITAGRSREGVFLAVRDHGPGLPPGAERTLFEQPLSAGDRKPGGAGLGLAICRLVVQAHGGSIAAKRCEPGTEFRIDLPAGTDTPREVLP
jgi:two-component system sensor histidine kinase KdpD